MFTWISVGKVAFLLLSYCSSAVGIFKYFFLNCLKISCRILLLDTLVCIFYITMIIVLKIRTLFELHQDFVGTFYLFMKVILSSFSIFFLVTWVFIFINLKRNPEECKNNKINIHVSHCPELLVFVHACHRSLYWPIVTLLLLVTFPHSLLPTDSAVATRPLCCPATQQVSVNVSTFICHT